MFEKKEKNKKQEYKKSITLADLIVAVITIAIVGVIASFVFTTYVKKASNTNATTELRQAQEIILSELVSAKSADQLTINCDGIIFEYDIVTGRVIYSGFLIHNDNGATFTKELLERFVDFSSLEGSFNIEDGSIIYTTPNGKGKAIWKSGKLPEKY